jgi:hypothetical protein
MERIVSYNAGMHPGNQIIHDKLLKFFSEFEGLCFQTNYNVAAQITRLDLVTLVMDAFRVALPDNRPTMTMYDYRMSMFVTASAILVLDDGVLDLWDAKATRHLNFFLHGDYETLKILAETIKAAIPIVTTPVVTWEFIAGNNRRSQNIRLEPAKPIFREFYPWIDNVPAYFDEFLNSDESILVLLGETGTAKTSFIRSMIWHANLTTMFTYEEELLAADALFVDFIVSDRTNLLVIEDADILLSSREHYGNRLMSKFLNVSDGLASGNGRKKIIFTANITEPNKIDSALLRVGRCFDCQTFRRLTYAEACAAAAVAKLPKPPVGMTPTLAELFALGKQSPRTARVQGIGFQRDNTR